MTEIDRRRGVKSLVAGAGLLASGAIPGNTARDSPSGCFRLGMIGLEGHTNYTLADLLQSPYAKCQGPARKFPIASEIRRGWS
jgi:hypothetical protein